MIINAHFKTRGAVLMKQFTKFCDEKGNSITNEQQLFKLIQDRKFRYTVKDSTGTRQTFGFPIPKAGVSEIMAYS